MRVMWAQVNLRRLTAQSFLRVRTTFRGHCVIMSMSCHVVMGRSSAFHSLADVIICGRGRNKRPVRLPYMPFYLVKRISAQNRRRLRGFNGNAATFMYSRRRRLKKKARAADDQ